MNLNIHLKSVDISPQESHGPIKLGIRNTEDRSWNSEKFLTVGKDSRASMKIGNVPSRFSEDSNIWIEMFLKTNESYVRSGETNISYSEIAEAMRNSNKRTLTKEVVYHQLSNTPVKALLTIDIDCENIGGQLTSSHQHNSLPEPFAGPYQIIESNTTTITQILKKNMEEAVSFMKIEPISDELNGVAAPYDQENVTLPAKLYFVDRSWKTIPQKFKEDFFTNSIGTSLRRNGMSAEEFNKTVDDMWKGGDVNDFKKWKVCKVVSDSTTLLSVSRPYLSDKGYYKGKESGIENFQHTERIESLDPESVAAGDCEDSARTIVSIYNALQSHMKEFSHDPLLLNASRIANLYVVGACLSTVTGSQLADSEGNPVKVHIGDPVEKNLEIGAHMFVLAMPFPHFHGMLNEEEVKLCKVNPEVQKRSHLASGLPHHILEGTGTLSPNVFPNKSYFGDEENINSAFTEQLNYIKAQVALSRSNPQELLNKAKIQKVPSSFEDEEGMQPVFIRTLSDIFVPQFHTNGDHFIFTNESYDKRGAWLRNVCLKDTYINGDKHYVEPKLFMSQRESEQEARIYANLEKQTPFSSGVYMDESTIPRRVGKEISGGRKREDIIHEFNEGSKKILRNRKPKGESTKINLFYIHDDFVEGDTPGKILADISNNTDIIGAESFFVPVDNFVHVVELELEIDISSFKYQGEVDNKEGGTKGISSSFNSKSKKKVKFDDKVMMKHIESCSPNSFIKSRNIFSNCGKENVSPFKALYIGKHSPDSVTSSLSKVLDKLLELTEKEAMNDPDYDGGNSTVAKFYGFRAVVALLKMSHIQKSLKKFLTDKRHKRTIVFPFLSSDDTHLVPELLEMGESVHLKVILDHLFYNGDVVPNKLDGYNRYPTLSKDNTHLLVQTWLGDWPDSTSSIILADYKEITRGNSRVPVLNFFDREQVLHETTAGFLFKDKDLNMEFIASEGLLLDPEVMM
jgi:hypothetical protein